MVVTVWKGRTRSAVSDRPSLPLVPEDSAINLWLTQWSYSEVYPSWRIAVALAMFGVVLRRNVEFGLGEVGHIWPNMSILLIGPSGDGKDTIINPAVKFLTDKTTCGMPLISGRTIEMIKDSIFKLKLDPAIGVLQAAELSALLGQKDYQQGIVTELTDILSSGDSVDISLKSTGVRTLPRPTLTMFAGSTRDWLITMLPEGSLEGGFLPRFVIVPELSKKDAGVHPAPNPGRLPKADLQIIADAKSGFQRAVIDTMFEYEDRYAVNIDKHGKQKPVQIIEDEEAAAWFENWYENRHAGFKASLRPFANRSAQLLRKLAMLMAISRRHNWIEMVDYEFAHGFIAYVAARLEETVIPVAREVLASYSILDVLPAARSEIMRHLGGKFGPRMVHAGVEHLLTTKQATWDKSGVLVKL